MKKLTKTLAAHKIVAGLVVVMLLVGTVSFLAATKEEEKKFMGYLGVNIEPISGPDKEEFQVKFGILVTGLIKGEAAEKAGIKKYDVIQFLNDEKMRRPEDLSETIRNLEPGSKAVIKLVRDGKEMSLTATLGKISEEPKFLWQKKGDFPKGEFPRGPFPQGHMPDGPFIFNSGGGAFLGVRLQALSADLANYFGVKADGGALVLNVEKDSPAQKAGLKDGDVIVQLDGKNIQNPEDVIKAIEKKEKGDKVDIQIIRHNKKESIKAELEKRKNIERIRIIKRGDGEDEDVMIDIPEFNSEKLHQQTQHLRNMEEKIRVQLEKKRDMMDKQKEKAEQIYQKTLKKINEKTYSI